MRQPIPTPVQAEVRQLAKVAFPNFRGRKFYVNRTESVNARSYWDGGSRRYFVFVRLADRARLPMPTSHPVFDAIAPSVEHLEIPAGAVCVEHHVFCGKDAGVTFHCRPDIALPALM